MGSHELLQWKFMFHRHIFFEISLFYVTPAGLELRILLPQPLECWNYQYAPPCLGSPQVQFILPSLLVYFIFFISYLNIIISTQILPYFSMNLFMLSFSLKGLPHLEICFSSFIAQNWCHLLCGAFHDTLHNNYLIHLCSHSIYTLVGQSIYHIIKEDFHVCFSITFYNKLILSCLSFH